MQYHCLKELETPQISFPMETSSHDHATHHSLQDSQNMQQKEGNSSNLELKQHGTDAPNLERENDSSQEVNCLSLQHTHAQDAYQPPQSEQDTLHASGTSSLQNSEKNPENLEPQHLKLKGMSNQQLRLSFAIGTNGQRLTAAETSDQPEAASGLSSQSAITVLKQDSQVHLGMLLPHILSQHNKDREMQLQTLR